MKCWPATSRSKLSQPAVFESLPHGHRCVRTGSRRRGPQTCPPWPASSRASRARRLDDVAISSWCAASFSVSKNQGHSLTRSVAPLCPQSVHVSGDKVFLLLQRCHHCHHCHHL